MAKKRVSVPDFEDIALSKITPTKEDKEEQSYNTTLKNIESQQYYESNVLNKENYSSEHSVKKSLPEIISSLFTPQQSWNQNIPFEQNDVKEETLDKEYFKNKPAQMTVLEEIPKIKEGYASFVLRQENLENENNIFETPTVEDHFEEEILLDKPLSSEEAIALIKKLNIWTVEPELEAEIVEPFHEYYYVTRSSVTMKKIGNSFVVHKNSGRVYQVNASMPENLNIKKIVNREIKHLN